MDKKVAYYKSKKLYNRLYGKTIEKENENYEKPCLEFTGYKNKNGYGRIGGYNKKKISTHKLSYALFNNIFPECIPEYNDSGEKLEILHGHGCSTSCIEPTHLTLGTHIQNMLDDKIRDGTILKGEKHHNCKISEEIALQIKLSKGDGTQKERAKKFNVTIAIVNSIDRNESWSHLPDINGNVTHNEEKRKKERKRNKTNKERIFTEEDWDNALKKLRNKSIVSDNIHKKVTTPCHLFQGCLDKHGYGRVRFKCIEYKAHILAIEAKFKAKRDKDSKLLVLHLCDTPQCCNPEHLKYGTLRENSLYALDYSKNVKLNEDTIRNIKLLLRDSNLTQTEIGIKHNTTYYQVHSIKKGNTWSHIEI